MTGDFYFYFHCYRGREEINRSFTPPPTISIFFFVPFYLFLFYFIFFLPDVLHEIICQDWGGWRRRRAWKGGKQDRMKRYYRGKKGWNVALWKLFDESSFWRLNYNNVAVSVQKVSIKFRRKVARDEDGNIVFLSFAARWGRVFGFKIFIKVMNLVWHLSSICEPYKFEFLFIEWIENYFGKFWKILISIEKY